MSGYTALCRHLIVGYNLFTYHRKETYGVGMSMERQEKMASEREIKDNFFMLHVRWDPWSHDDT